MAETRVYSTSKGQVTVKDLAEITKRSTSTIYGYFHKGFTAEQILQLTPETATKIKCPDGNKRTLYEVSLELNLSYNTIHRRYKEYLLNLITYDEVFKPRKSHAGRPYKNESCPYNIKANELFCLQCPRPKCVYDSGRKEYL